MKKILFLSAFAILLAACQPMDSTPPTPENNNPPTLGMPVDSNHPVQEMIVEENGEVPSMKLAEGATFQLPEGTFIETENDFEGEVFVKGYAQKTEVDEVFCSENCKKYDRVTFNVTDVRNEAFKKFMNQDTPITFGLGCLNEQGKIKYSNQSNQAGQIEMRDYELDEALSQSILSATEESPIILKLTRVPSGGPIRANCYSQFMSVDQLAV